MSDEQKPRCSIKLVFYESRAEGGQFMGATTIVVAADTVPAGVDEARKILGEDVLKSKNGYYVESVVAFEAVISS